jgi:SynChlorMet cassette protein ScmD
MSSYATTPIVPIALHPDKHPCPKGKSNGTFDVHGKMSMTLSDKPFANPTVVLREEFDDWAVLFNPDTADAVGINPVGVAIWKLMDGTCGFDEIIKEIGERFSNVPETALQEVTTFVEELTRLGFVGYEVKDT